ncbi:MAG: hypothetical protein AAGA92_14855 [Planctomycetota bacterium]
MVDFPDFQSDYLTSLIDDLRSRSKGITHLTEAWTCERVFDEAEQQECLVVDLQCYLRDQVRLRFWDDGTMWFRACRPAPVGWEYMLAFNGVVSGFSTGLIVELLKQSLGQDPDRLLGLWEHASPQIERAESRS